MPISDALTKIGADIERRLATTDVDEETKLLFRAILLICDELGTLHARTRALEEDQ